MNNANGFERNYNGASNDVNINASDLEWPQAPDLQLDCLSSESDTDDDDSSVEVVGVSLNSLPKGPSVSSLGDPKPGPSGCASLNSWMTPKQGSNSLRKSTTKHNGKVSNCDSTSSAVLIDLTQSDDEGPQMNSANHSTRSSCRNFNSTNHSNLSLNRSRRLSSNHHENLALNDSTCVNKVNGANSFVNANSSHSRASCIQQNPASQQSSVYNVMNSGFPPLLPEFTNSCRYQVNNGQTPQIHSNNGATDHPPDLSNSFNNFFPINPAVSVAASTGPCPAHSHFYSAPSPSQTIPFVPSSASIVGSTTPAPTSLHQAFFNPPPAHHVHSYHTQFPSSRIHPNHQRLWYAQQRMQEMQRHRVYQHQLLMQR